MKNLANLYPAYGEKNIKIYYLIMVFSTAWFIIVGNILVIAAFAFISGSLEALVYDTLVARKKEDLYDEIASKVSALNPAITILTAIIGGLLWRFSIYLPWILSCICFAISFVLSFYLQEPPVDTYKFSWKGFVEQNRLGFAELTSKKMIRFLPVFVAIAASFYMWSTGIVRIAMGEELEYNGETLSYLIGAVSIVSTFILYRYDKLKGMLGNKTGLLVIALMSAIGWTLAGYGGGLFMGAIIFLLITISGHLHQPWASSIINKNVPSQMRATTISTMQFFVQIPYVIVVVFYGALIDQGQTNIFYYATGALIAGSIVLSYLLRNHKETV